MAPLMLLFFFLVASSDVKFVSSQFPSCAQSLIPCGKYMKDPSPPSDCCDVLKKTIENELDCLCKLYSAPNFFSSLNLNKTDSLTLATRCKISGGSCNGTVAPTSQPSPPPRTLGSNGHYIGKVSWTATCTLLLFWVSFMFQ